MADHSQHGHSHDHPHAHDVTRPAVSRRALLAGVGGGLLILAAAPGTAQAGRTGIAESATPTVATGASRTSLVTRGTTLVHADLHNHSEISDGDGDPRRAYGSMRAAGLDVAALTDHTTLLAVSGMNRDEWDDVAAYANAANDPGRFTAIRGFEWSHPLLGHVNVWFTRAMTDLGESPSMRKLYEWIHDESGIAGFNHPGRERLRFDDFNFRASARDAMVSMEIFNRRDDFLFDGWDAGQTSPLNRCLNAGWRTGLTGVSDEHGDDWGFPEGKGRTGIWVTENTRAEVKAAMRARRFFATRVSGLRLDATANDIPIGGTIPVAARADVRFRVDLDRGPDWVGKPLRVQVLRPGGRAPAVPLVVETESGRVAEFTVPLDLADGAWVVLRISDPTRANPTPGPGGHPCNDWGVAYTSPWWLAPVPRS